MTTEPDGGTEAETEWVCTTCGPVADEHVSGVGDSRTDPDDPWGIHIGCKSLVTRQPVE